VPAAAGTALKRRAKAQAARVAAEREHEAPSNKANASGEGLLLRNEPVGCHGLGALVASEAGLAARHLPPPRLRHAKVDSFIPIFDYWSIRYEYLSKYTNIGTPPELSVAGCRV
jgi:hypothetical protein